MKSRLLGFRGVMHEFTNFAEKYESERFTGIIHLK